MIKIFVANKTEYHSSKELIERLLKEYYGETEFLLTKTETGKPLLQSVKNVEAKFLSVSHTSKKYFIAFSPFEIGIDAELCSREVDYLPILKKFDEREQKKIKTTRDFLSVWTKKESVIKYLGSTLKSDLKNVQIVENDVVYNSKPLPVFIRQIEAFDHILAVCQEGQDEVVFEKV